MIDMRWVYHDFADGSPPTGSIRVGDRLYQKLQFREISQDGVYLIGWVNNIISIVHSDFGHITGTLVIRCVGIFVAPLGVVMGYF